MLSWEDIHEMERVDDINGLDCLTSVKGALTTLGHGDEFAWGMLFVAMGFDKDAIQELDITRSTQIAEIIHQKAIENGTIDNLRKMGQELEEQENAK